MRSQLYYYNSRVVRSASYCLPLPSNYTRIVARAITKQRKCGRVFSDLLQVDSRKRLQLESTLDRRRTPRRSRSNICNTRLRTHVYSIKKNYTFTFNEARCARRNKDRTALSAQLYFTLQILCINKKKSENRDLFRIVLL